MARLHRRGAVLLLALLALAPARADAQVVISQIFANGGSSGAYERDYVEIFNRGNSPVNLAGWSVQYASATGSAWQVTALSGAIAPGQHYLVAESLGGSGNPLPTPDVTGGILLSSSGGKVAVVSNITALAGSCPANPAIFDFVGYGGNANCFETTAAAAPPSNALLRGMNGCVDTNNNNADFISGTPNPRNTASPFTSCSTPIQGSGTANPSTVSAGGTTLLTVTVTPGGNPVSTGITVTGNLWSIGGSAAQAFYDDGTHGDVTPGNNVFSYQATVSAGTVAGGKSLPISVQDAEARTATPSISLTVTVVSLTIHEIQGPGATSPYLGQVVTTDGILTRRVPDGFFLQTPDGLADADPNTSEAIFVHDPTHASSGSAGDRITVSGTVAEMAMYPDALAPRRTQIEYASHGILSSGNPIPGPVTIQPADFPTSGPMFGLERLESMRITFPSITVVQPTGGTYSLPNNVVTSKTPCFAVLGSTPTRPRREAGYDRRWTLPAGAPCCVPAWDANPEAFAVEGLSYRSAGTIVLDVLGELDYADRRYSVRVDAYGPVSSGLGTVPVSDVAADEFTIGSLHLDRFYDSTDDPFTSDIVVMPAPFNVRLGKVVPEIHDVMKLPDVLCVQSVENLSTLQTIANAVNLAGADYAPYLVEGNDPFGLDVGFLVRTGRIGVGSVTQLEKSATYVEPTTGQTVSVFDQPPLLLTGWAINGAGPNTPVTVMALQMTPVAGADTSAAIRNRRRQQAEHVASLLQARQTASPTENLIAIGIESYEVSDGAADVFGTIRGTPAPANEVLMASPDLVSPDLVDAGAALTAANRYDTSQDGGIAAMSQCLFADNVAALFRRTEYARCNADAPESLRTASSVPDRAGPRDGMVVYLHHAGTTAVDDSRPLSLAIEIVRRAGAANAPLAVTLTLPSAAPASLEAFDVSGRRIGRADLRGFEPGRHVVTLSLRGRGGSEVVVLALRQDGRRVVEKRSLLR